MSLDPRELARQRIDQAVATRKHRDEKADAAIWAAVVVNAGLGFVPLAINIWTFLGVTTVLAISLGAIYGHHVSNEGAGKILRNILTSVRTTTLALAIGMKFFVEVLKGVGVITMGGTTLAGMALDAALCGAVTYAVGYTSKEYFKRDQVMSKDQIRTEFERAFAEGKQRMKDQQPQPPQAGSR